LTQADLNKIAQLHGRWLEGQSSGAMADFSGMELMRLNFDRLNFEQANFAGTRISDCNLCGNFMFADFRGAEIYNCFAGHCSFEGADFTDATCKNCDFTRADMENMHLRRAIFESCDFTRANMECSDFTAAKFSPSPHAIAATAMCWGDVPPARDAETLVAEGKFIAGMLGLGFADEQKITEWMDEAWSNVTRDAAFHELPPPCEPAYRLLLAQYSDAFSMIQKQYPAAAEEIYNHGEEFSPADLPGAAAYLAGGGSLQVARHLQMSGLFDRHADDFALLQETAESIVTQAIEHAEDGEFMVNLGDAMGMFGVPDRYDFDLADLLRDRSEVTDLRFDPDELTASLELDPAFLQQSWQQIIASM
jgi:uncharacterized protein YjbI with pentapeptide repeats